MKQQRVVRKGGHYSDPSGVGEFEFSVSLGNGQVERGHRKGRLLKHITVVLQRGEERVGGLARTKFYRRKAGRAPPRRKGERKTLLCLEAGEEPPKIHKRKRRLLSRAPMFRGVWITQTLFLPRSRFRQKREFRGVIAQYVGGSHDDNKHLETIMEISVAAGFFFALDRRTFEK